MRLLLSLAVVGFMLTGCTTTEFWSKANSFLGSADRCVQGAAIHAAFVTVASKDARVAKYVKQERALYAAFKEQCADGSLNKLSLQKALNAYVAAVDELRS